MTDHQTPSRIPDDAGKPPNDDWSDSYLAAQWAKIWDDLRPSVRPAWLGPKPAGPTAHYWVNADGSAVRTAVDTGDAGFRAGDVVRVVNGRIARSLPDQVGPGHDDPRAGIVSTVPPNTGPPPSITWDDVKAAMDRLLSGSPRSCGVCGPLVCIGLCPPFPRGYRPAETWHWQPTPGGGWYSGPPNPAITTAPCGCRTCPEILCAACLAPATPGHACDAVKRARAKWQGRVVPSVRVCQCDDDDCGGTCAGSRRPEPTPCPPEPDWHKGCTWCWRTIWHAGATLDGEPTLTDSEGNLWHLDDEALQPLYRAENLDGPSLPLYVITQMVGPMSVPPTTGEQS
jgi:hypothetical protein